jgi:hypothetical protein
MSKCNIPFELKNVTASFVKVFEPQPKMSGRGEEYSVQLIIPKDHPQIEALKGAIMKIAKEAFPGQTLPADCRLIRDSDAEGKGQQYEYMQNTYFCNVRRDAKQGKVPCAMPDGNLFDPTPQVLFSGCLVNAHIGLYDYEVRNQSNVVIRRGVTGALNGLQLVDNVNVERLGGGAPTPTFGVVDGANVKAVLGEGHTAQAKDEVAPAQSDKIDTVAEDEDIPW